MKTSNLPKSIDAWQWARSNDPDRTLEGYLPIYEMNGLHDIVEPDSSHIFLKAHFAKDSEGRAVLVGHWQAKLYLHCQRCLDLMPLELEADINLTLVESERVAKSLPPDYDALILGYEEMLSISKLLTEEILLALPLVPKHEDSYCSKYLTNLSSEEQPKRESKGSPFAVLESLKVQKQS